MALDGWTPYEGGATEIWLGTNFGAVVVSSGPVFRVAVWRPTRQLKDKYCGSLAKAKAWAEVQLVVESLAPRVTVAR